MDVAAAFVRWLIQYPYPTASDSDRLATTGLASDAPTKDLTGFFATGPNLSGGLVPDSTDYYLSTIPGVWHLESSSGTEVEATIGTGVVINGELSPNLRGSITVTLRWEGGKWKFVKSVGTRSTEDLYAIGKPFASGC
ncbi:hypothetical protein E3O44_06880 [Cryobacterium algoricola]|uniref:DUF4440 domain-containing protein n=1 Tax=Cryobacterium algoricola TaxID=1259183 RepID=A0ABY2IBD1_9MICO|nr:hypothetical protein [Cryobacterium algoricola]TFB86885.1 hypothetical protein E3O44_06880 [Cryobacterium algoricola]